MRRILVMAALAALPAVAGAQRNRTEDEKNSSTVPVHMLPPAGKCRIWMIGVPPAQQPAPTDCQTALRQRPENGVVVFGPVEREGEGSACGGRPPVAPGANDRRSATSREPSTSNPRGGSGSSAPGGGGGSVRESLREPTREPTRQPASAPARTESRAPASDARRETSTRPPSGGTARPTTQDPPVKKPPAERPSTLPNEIADAVIGKKCQEPAS